MSKLPITVILITLNEGENLPGALNCIREWAHDIFVIDSRSTDKTIDIALKYGARIVQRPFTNFGDHWNWTLGHLPIDTPWTLKLDPDERVSEELLESFRRIVADPTAAEAWRIRRRLWFMGKPMHQYGWEIRLWKTGQVRFSDVIINEQPITNGRIDYAAGTLEHLDSPTLHHWYAKQNIFSTMRAIEMYQNIDPSVKPKLLGDPLARRMWIKRIFFSFPFRYGLLFLYLLLAKGALRDGYVGVVWARLRTQVYRAAEYKLWEMRHTGKVPETPRPAHGDFDPRIMNTDLQARVMADRAAWNPKEQTDT